MMGNCREMNKENGVNEGQGSGRKVAGKYY
jgi:hypothetical protein